MKLFCYFPIRKRGISSSILGLGVTPKPKIELVKAVKALYVIYIVIYFLAPIPVTVNS